MTIEFVHPTGQIGSQALELGLIDQVVVNQVRVVFGSGRPLFATGGLAEPLDHQSRKQRARYPDREWVLPRAHRALSNLKTWLQGTHHGVSPQHLHVYPDEFVFRHNRRLTPLAGFQTLLGLGTAHEPTTYHEITHRAGSGSAEQSG